MFYRGNDVYDTRNLGFVSDVPEQAGRRFSAYDTAKPGNSNVGHEGKRYGTELQRGRQGCAGRVHEDVLGIRR